MNGFRSTHTGRKAALRARLMPERGGFSLADGLVRTEADFRCTHCGYVVSTDPLLSGVNNRNHCPYCLHSKHLDLFQAGDRLAACKAPMRPVALTRKRTRDKYGGSGQGELMLVHLCLGCDKVSLNRIAADDHPRALLEVFTGSLALDETTAWLLEQASVDPLTEDDAPALHLQLGVKAL